jgi:hypothetical protein
MLDNQERFRLDLRISPHPLLVILILIGICCFFYVTCRHQVFY